MIQTLGELVQKVGSFTEIFLKGTGSGAAGVSSIDTAKKGKGTDLNRQKPYYGVGLKKHWDLVRTTIGYISESNFP